MLTCWQLKRTDEVWYFIRMLLWIVQCTIVAVIADGSGPGRQKKEND